VELLFHFSAFKAELYCMKNILQHTERNIESQELKRFVEKRRKSCETIEIEIASSYSDIREP
jgi:hypothetical protein